MAIKHNENNKPNGELNMQFSTLPWRTTLVAAAVVTVLGACSKQAEQVDTQGKEPMTEAAAVQSGDNPFFQEYTTPFQIPPFADIKNEDFMPAFEKGMADHLADIDSIVNNPDSPTFENTIEALERSGKLLSKVQAVFFNLTGSNTNPELQKLQRDISPLISAHYDKVTLNEGLFERIDTLWQMRDTLELGAVEQRFLEDTYKSFAKRGAKLEGEAKQKLTELNGEIAKLTTEYGQNLLAETNGFELVLDKTDLDGLSEGVIQAAAATAKSKMDAAETDEDKAKYADKYVFTPHRSSMYPFLTESTRRDLREALYKSYVMRGDNNNDTDNKAIAAKLAKLRAERAALLGYATHADYILEDRMVNTPDGVYELLMELWKPAVARAKREVADMQAVIDAEGHDFKFAAWDWWQYAEKVRKAKYDLDEASIKPYLTLDNVLNGAFDTANKLWG